MYQYQAGMVQSAMVAPEQGLCNSRSSIRLSLCLSVPSSCHTPLLQVCSCGPGGQEILIRLLLQWQVNAGTAVLSAYTVAEHRLVSQTIHCSQLEINILFI